MPRSSATCAIGRPLSSAKRTPRSSSSSGYFLGLDMTAEDLLSPGQHPGSEVPAKPGPAHLEKVELRRVVGLTVFRQVEAELPKLGALVGEKAVERVVEHRRYQLPHDQTSLVSGRLVCAEGRGRSLGPVFGNVP